MGSRKHYLQRPEGFCRRLFELVDEHMREGLGVVDLGPSAARIDVR